MILLNGMQKEDFNAWYTKWNAKRRLNYKKKNAWYY